METREAVGEQFMLTINLDTMRNVSDLADALRGVAGELEAGRVYGLVRDKDGNDVGGFRTHPRLY